MTPKLLFLDLRDPRMRPMAAPQTPCVLCLGNFDGVHLAHKALLREGISLAARIRETYAAPTEQSSPEGGVLCGAFCFFRPSHDALSSRDGAHPAHLTSLREKLIRFRAVGISFVCLCDFDEVRTMAPVDFLQMLSRQCRCVGAVCGFNFRFGHHAVGTAEAVTAYFPAGCTTVMPELRIDGDTVSASRIREALLSGDAEGAARLLGCPYSLTATVSPGKQLGRTIGFPTANQHFPSEALIPAHGVYAALCYTPDGVFPGVANVGTHPTIDTHARINCETYIIGYCGDLYGRRMTVELLRHLRPEQKFADLAALTAAIRHDVKQALTYLREHGLTDR